MAVSKFVIQLDSDSEGSFLFYLQRSVCLCYTFMSAGLLEEDLPKAEADLETNGEVKASSISEDVPIEDDTEMMQRAAKQSTRPSYFVILSWG